MSNLQELTKSSEQVLDLIRAKEAKIPAIPETQLRQLEALRQTTYGSITSYYSLM